MGSEVPEAGVDCAQLQLMEAETVLVGVSKWRSAVSFLVQVNKNFFASQNGRAFSLEKIFYFASQNGRSGAVAVSVVDTGAEAGEENAKQRTSRALLVEMKNSWKHVSKKSVRVTCQFICLSVSEKLNSNYTTTTTNQIKERCHEKMC